MGPRDDSGDTPGGVFLIDPETFDVLGRWEVERGPQRLAYDFWWHLGYDTAVTSEWGAPNTVENGLVVHPSIAALVSGLRLRLPIVATTLGTYDTASAAGA